MALLELDRNAFMRYHLNRATNIGQVMANISVRKLDEQVYNRLRVRAAQHDVSIGRRGSPNYMLVMTAPDLLLKNYNVSQTIRPFIYKDGGI